MGLLFKKVRRDFSWTLAIALILTAGLTAWIIIPSISGSLQTGLEDYGNRVSTFIVVQNTAGLHPGSGSQLLQNSVTRIESIAGVQAVYPIEYNYTFQLTTSKMCLQSGCRNVTLVEGITSAVIGGKNGFPLALIPLVKGHLPQGNESAFVENSSGLGIFHNGTYQLEIGSSEWNSTQSVKFNATGAGVTALNPLTGQVEILWDSTFLQHELGTRLYNSTFGGPPNFMIIKADNIGQVESVASSVSQILKSNSTFFVTYDQATLLALQSLESQSLPLYELLSGVSLAATTLVLFLVSYLGAVRRKWEPGLFLTQGWTWARYSRFVVSYFFVVAIAASALSALLSLIIERFLLYHFPVSGNVLTITTTIDPLYLISTIPLSFLVSGLAALASTSRMKRMGLDTILRDY